MTTSASPSTFSPLWYRRTSTICSCHEPLSRQDSWDNDDVLEPEWATSPTDLVQCLMFLVHIDRLEIHETDHKRCHDPVFRINLYLSEEDASKPTLQIERTRTEFEKLRNDVVYWTTGNVGDCEYCMRFQDQNAAWEQLWSHSALRQFAHLPQWTRCEPSSERIGRYSHALAVAASL